MNFVRVCLIVMFAVMVTSTILRDDKPASKREKRGLFGFVRLVRTVIRTVSAFDNISRLFGKRGQGISGDRDREENFAEVFKFLDVDKNGFIDMEELQRFEAVVKGDRKPEDIMADVDTNRDNQIDFDEFFTGVQRGRERDHRATWTSSPKKW